MKFTIEINCDNAAFEDGWTTEVIRILEHVQDRLRVSVNDCLLTLRDINGNVVGNCHTDES